MLHQKSPARAVGTTPRTRVGVGLGLSGVCALGLVVAFLVGATTATADIGTTTTATGTTPTETTPTETTPTETTPTETTPTETTPTETTPTETTPTGQPTIRLGVTIAGQDVGGLTGAEARAVVGKRFLRSFLLVVSKNWSRRVTAVQLGARARIDKAVKSALTTRIPGANIPLTVDFNDAVLERYLAALGKETFREPRDSELRLVRLVPSWTEERAGRRLQERIAFLRLRHAIRKHVREPFPLPFAETKPGVTNDRPPLTIVVRRESKVLQLYRGSELKRTFGVATGQSSYPTPLGRWTIVNKQRHPWWYPPQESEWARGQEPVPPGPGNPLGTRWMGLSAPLVGIHGTPNAASIGYSASHGCIRMRIPEAEWLFERVEIGTTVFIVRA